MFTPENGRHLARRVGLALLVLCAVMLALENTVLIAYAAMARPWAILSTVGTVMHAVTTLAMPVGLLSASAALVWWNLPGRMRDEHDGALRGRDD
jgi:uncharacterized membrane protein YdjX (TVP38/TMEM64 family)